MPWMKWLVYFGVSVAAVVLTTKYLFNSSNKKINKESSDEKKKEKNQSKQDPEDLPELEEIEENEIDFNGRALNILTDIKEDRAKIVKYKKNCPHIKDYLNPVPLAYLKDKCDICESSIDRFICLSCYKTFCEDHMKEHVSTEKHCIGLKDTMEECWCYQCNEIIFDDIISGVVALLKLNIPIKPYVPKYTPEEQQAFEEFTFSSQI